MSCIYAAETAFTTVFPIQLAVFVQTLVRKGKISSTLWHPIYASSLAIPLILNIPLYLRDTGEGLKYTLVGSLCWVLRTQLGFNKYAVWSVGVAILLVAKISPDVPRAGESITGMYIAFAVFGVVCSLATSTRIEQP